MKQISAETYKITAQNFKTIRTCMGFISSCYIQVVNGILIIFLAWSFRIIETSIIKCWELSTGARRRNGMLHLFIVPHVQTESNRVCNFHVILLLFMLPRDYLVSRNFFFYFQVPVSINGNDIINGVHKPSAV
jgi:hypothetical protein